MKTTISVKAGRLYPNPSHYPPFRIVTDEESVAHMVQSLDKCKVLAFDCEATGRHPTKDYPIMVGLCGDDCEDMVEVDGEMRPVVYIIPVAMRGLEDGDKNCPRDLALRALRYLMGNKERIYTSHNVKFDLHQLANIGIEVRGTIWCSLYMAFLLKGKDLELIGLDAQTVQRLKIPAYSYPDIVEKPKTIMGKLADEDLVLVASYCSMDAYRHLILAFMLRKELRKKKRPKSNQTFWTLAVLGFRYVRVLWSMERRGFLVNEKSLKKKIKRAEKDLLNLERGIFKAAAEFGEEFSSPDTFNLNSGDQLRALFKKMGVDRDLSVTDIWRCTHIEDVEVQLKTKVRIDQKRCKGKVRKMSREWDGHSRVLCPLCGSRIKPVRSTDRVSLDYLADKGVEFAGLMRKFRKVSKLLSTFLVAMVVHKNERTGRVHSTFNQTGARTGRLSSKEPNLQNIPATENDVYLVREVFIAPPGRSLIVADYSQLELRVTAHFSNEQSMIDAFHAGHDLHATTAARMFHIPEHVFLDRIKHAKEKEHRGEPLSTKESLAVRQRHSAKTINFGVLYGMGRLKLAGALKITETESQKYLDQWARAYPNVIRLRDMVHDNARATGYTRTILGRTRSLLPYVHSRDSELRAMANRMAFNTLIQGSAADIVMMAMLKIEDACDDGFLFDAEMLLQVHDELIIEVTTKYAEEAAKRIRALMEFPFREPLRVPMIVDPSIGKSWGGAKRG